MKAAAPPPPGESEALLLRAGLGSGEAAFHAWRRWRESFQLDGIDQSSFRLLPLVARNAGVVPEYDPLFGAIQGVHRKAWIENQILFRKLDDALSALARVGIRPVVLKGAALVADAYDDAGRRPMSDVDLLVPPSRAADAAAALTAAGFSPMLPPSTLGRRHAIGFRKTGDALACIDLHVRPMAVRTPAAFDARLFAEARPRMFMNRTEILVPSPTTHVVLVCAHAMFRSSFGVGRWIADATLLLRRHAASFDWDRFQADVSEARLVRPLRHGLRLIKTVFDAPIPEAVLVRMATAPLSLCERIEGAEAGSPSSAVREAAHLIAPWFRLPREAGPRLCASASLLPETVGRGFRFLWRHGIRGPVAGLRSSRGLSGETS